MIRRSLAFRVLIASLLLLGLPLLITSFLLFKRAYDSDIGIVKNNLWGFANYRAATLTEYYPFKSSLLEEMNYFVNFEEMLGQKKGEEFQKEFAFLQTVDSKTDFFLLDSGSEGRMNLIGSSMNNVAPKTISLSCFSDLARDEGKVTTFFPFSSTKEVGGKHFIFFLIRPLYSEKTKEIIGYLIGMQPIDDMMQKVVESKNELGQVVKFAFIGEDGVAIAASDKRLIGERLSESKMMPVRGISKKALPIVQKEGGPFFEFVWDKKIQIGYLVDTPLKGGSLLAYSSKEQVFSAAIRHFFFLYTIFGVFIIVGAIVTYKLTQVMASPLRQLAEKMSKVSQGELNERYVQEPLGYEVNQLGAIFNETLTSLISSIQKEQNNRVAKEMVKNEVEIGRRVQEQLLPQALPSVKNVELYASYLASREAGGDFYDVNCRKGKLILTVADAAGKGIASSLYALGLRSQLRACSHLHDDVGVIMSEANNLFCRDVGDTGMFVTALMGIYDLKDKSFSYYSAGHVPGVVRKQNGSIRLLSRRGMAMGLMPSQPYLPERITLENGDMILLFTDGLISVVNEKHQFFGESKLKDLMQHRPWFTAREVIEGMVEEVKRYSGKAVQEEEVTLLAMRVVEE